MALFGQVFSEPAEFGAENGSFDMKFIGFFVDYLGRNFFNSLFTHKIL